MNSRDLFKVFYIPFGPFLCLLDDRLAKKELIICFFFCVFFLFFFFFFFFKDGCCLFPPGVTVSALGCKV